VNRIAVRVALFASILCVAVVSVWVVNERRSVTQARIAAGVAGGEGHIFATALADVVRANADRIELVVVETDGGTANMAKLGTADVDFAIAQNDVPPPGNARTVAFLYPQLFHLAVRADSLVQTVGDLRGLRVGTPPAGGGSYTSFMTLLDHYGLRPEDMTLTPMKSSELPERFGRGELDAVFRVDRIGDDGIKRVLAAADARLVPIDQAAAMQLARPYLGAFVIPRGAYRAVPALPSVDLETVGVQTVLFAGAGADARVVEEVTQALFDHRRDLFAHTPAAAFVSSAADAGGAAMALHAGARAHYDREKPGFLVVYSEVIALLMTLAGMGLTVALAARSRMKQGQKALTDHYQLTLVGLLQQAREAADTAAIDRVEGELYAIFAAIVKDVDEDRVSTEELQAFAVTWTAAMEAVRDRLRRSSR
jgi:TRAP transporter TAXI family solute receptor